MERYLVANDIGRAINPMLVEGQIVGGFAQGLGGALYEEFRYDGEAGQPLSTTLRRLPDARPSAEMPKVDVLIAEDAPEPAQSAGRQRAPGRAAPTPSARRSPSAVDDALRRPGAVTALPIVPFHRCTRLLGGTVA